MAEKSSSDSPSFETYPNWLHEQFPDCGRLISAGYYEAVTLKIKNHVSSANWCGQLRQKLQETADEYNVRSRYLLFAEEPKWPVVEIKPYSSFLKKSYRHNILNNANWPNPPEGDWMEPAAWFSKIKDVVRTLLVAKYLDGAIELAQQIEAFSRAEAKGCSVDYEAKEHGYYAIHVVVRDEISIPTETFETHNVIVPIEIQITTQLQEIMRRLTHREYEQRRMTRFEATDVWQWDYRSDEFGTNYLGHVLHYIEGMIMQIRDRAV